MPGCEVTAELAKLSIWRIKEHIQSPRRAADSHGEAKVDGHKEAICRPAKRSGGKRPDGNAYIPSGAPHTTGPDQTSRRPELDAAIKDARTARRNVFLRLCTTAV